MLVVTRFDVTDADDFLARARAAVAVLATRPGYRRAWVGRAVDAPELWTLTTEWDGVGAWRRALSAYDVKMQAWELLGRARDEPTAYETVLVDGAETAGEPPRGTG